MPFVIHGYELRGFVEASAEHRYDEVVTWFSLQPLLTVQQQLRSLQMNIRRRIRSNTQIDERNLDLRRLTSGAILDWEDTALRNWFNAQILASLDSNLMVEDFSETDHIFSVLSERKTNEEERLGLTTLNVLISKIDRLLSNDSDSEDGQLGALQGFLQAISDYEGAVERESTERHKASHAVFNEVWTQAKEILENQNVDIQACPVCDTEFLSTPHGSREAVGIVIGHKLGMLADYQKARLGLQSSEQELSKTKATLLLALKDLRTGLVDASFSDQLPSLVSFLEQMEGWEFGLPVPEYDDLACAMSSVRTALTETKLRLIEQQGEGSYASALQLFSELVQVKDDLERIHRTKEELRKIFEQLAIQSRLIETAINQHILGLLDELEADVNDLYWKIQGSSLDSPAAIHLRLSEESAANQQQLRLVIDYADNRPNVAPTGYLSDSQIHTVALSLRLAAIRRFNLAAPLMYLTTLLLRTMRITGRQLRQP